MLTVDDKTLLNTTFTNLPSSSTQAFPGNYPDEQHPPQTGAAEVDSLGYLAPASALPQDTVYHMTFTFEHDANAAVVYFAVQPGGCE